MDRLLPHPPFAEDQPYGKTILWTHIMTRALPTGAFVGLGISGVRAVIPRKTPIPEPGPATLLGQSKAPLKIIKPTGLARLLATNGTSVAVTSALMVPATVARMWGREQIEWQDRSWRLLESKGQVEVDYWTYGGAVVGLLGQGLMGPAGGWKVKLGAAGVGSLAGVGGYMGWRYGVNGGKFE